MAQNFSQTVDPASAAGVNPMQVTGIAPGQHAQSMLHMMFGPPPVTQSRAFGQDISTTHEDVYAAYEGDNLYLADTVKGFILMNREWYTSVIPWLQTNQMHIKWNTFEFNRALAGPVPNEGVPRLISHRTRGQEGSISRYGIGFEMEGDMIGTGAGLVMYRRNVAGLAQSCLETVNYHTVYALKSCKTAEQQRQDLMREYGKTLQQIEEIEASDFAMLANDPNEVHRVIEQQRALVRAEDGEIDTLIVHEDFAFFQDMVAEGSLTQYYQLGPRGQQMLTEGPVSDGTFRGIPIFKSRRFKVYDSGPKIQPLVDNVSLGEHYVVDATAFRGSEEIESGYKTSWRDIYLYSIDTDRYEKLQFNDIFLHANMFGGAVGDDADKLSPSTYALADDYNAQFSDAPTTRDDAMAMYGNRTALENTATSKSARRVYLMLAHNTDTQEVAPVERFAEFDIDVVTTQDLRQASTSLVNALFNSDAERIQAYADLSTMQQLVQRLEQANYSESFMRALAAENVSRSVDEGNVFRGDPLRADQTEVIDWAPNAYGGLDLPQRKLDNGKYNFPAEGSFLASYPMIATLAKQGEARDYPPDMVSAAKSTVAICGKLSQRIMAAAGASDALGEASVPDWFKVKSPELSIFNHLHISRPPVFLGVNSDAKGEAKKNVVPVRAAPKEPKTSIALWTGGTRTSGDALVALATLPRAKLLAAMLDLKAEDKIADVAQSLASDTLGKVAKDLQNFFTRWFFDAGPDKVAEAEQGRRTLVGKLFELFETNKGNAVYATFAREAVREAFDEISALQSSVFEKADEIVAIIDAKIKSVPKTYAKKARALDEKTKENTKKYGEKLILLARGVNAIKSKASAVAAAADDGGGDDGGGDDGGGDDDDDDFLSQDTLDEVASRLNEDVSSNLSYAAALRMLSDKVDARALVLAGYTDVPFTGDNADAFAEALAMSEAPQAAVDEFIKYAEQRAQIAEQAQAIVDDVLDATSSAAASVSPMLIGDEVPVKDDKGKAVAWYRAPLAASPATIRSLASADKKDVNPAVLPADKETGYRYYVMPVAGGKLDVTQFSSVMSDVAMLPMVNSRIEVGAKPLVNEPLVRNLMATRPYVDRHADFRLANVAGAYEERRPAIGMRQRADGTYAIEDDVHAIGARMDAINADRARRGLPPADFSAEFTNADNQRRQLDRAATLARQRAETAQALSSTAAAAGVEIGQSTVANDPLRRAAMVSHVARLDRPLEEHHRGLGVSAAHNDALRSGGRRYDRGSYQGAVDSRSSQFDVNRHNDFLPDAAYMREPRTVYYGGQYAGIGAGHPHGHGHGYDSERGYAVAAPFGVGVQGHPGAGAGQYNVFYDQYGREVYVNAGQVVGNAANLDRFGRPRDGSALDSPIETEASRKKLHPNAVYRYAQAEKEEDPLVRMAMRVLLETPNRASAWQALLKANVYLPISFIVWRLHIEFEMSSIIALQSGIETGANVIGHQSMVFANRAVDHMMHANMTFWHRPFIFNEQFVRIMPNMMPRSYVAGWDMNWIMSADELEEEQRGSLIATPLAVTEKIDKSTLTFIDTTLPRRLPSLTNRQKNQTVLPDHSSASMAAKIWHLGEQAIANGDNAGYLSSSGARVNVRSRAGKYFTYNARDRMFNVKHHGKSGLSGNRTGPGVKQVWLGNGRAMFPDQLAVEGQLRLQ